MNFATIIENKGVLTTDEFDIGFILSEDNVPNIGDFLLSTKTIAGLDPGQEVVHESDINISDLDINTGEYYLIARLDINESIEENDKMNNDFISTFPIEIISSTEKVFDDAEIMIFISDQSLVIKNENPHYVKMINIYRSDGVELLNRKVENANYEYEFEVNNYTTGIYFVRIEIEDQFLVKKVFIP